MRAALTTRGSYRDVTPFLTLALELRRRGHDPVLGLPPTFERDVKALDLAFQPVGPGLTYSELARRRAFANLASYSRVDVIRGYESVGQLIDLCDGADLLISGTGLIAASIVHEVTHIPFVSIQLEPSAAGLSQRFLIGEAIDPIAGEVNRCRELHGLPQVFGIRSIESISPQLALCAMNPHFHEYLAGPHGCHRQTGFFSLEGIGMTAESDLLDFVSKHDPPIVFAFGDTVRNQQESLATMLIEAAQIAGVPAIIESPPGWSGNGCSRQVVYAAEFIDYDWIFPRAACVVHPNRLTAIAPSIRSGVPGICVFDDETEPGWQALARELGYPAFRYHELDAATLAAAIDTAISSSGALRSAASLREQVREEDGVKKAASLIEEFLESAGLVDGRSLTVQWAKTQEAPDSTRRKALQHGLRQRRNNLSV
jgi:sterol 3beta-glucosyltransferase